MTNTTSAAKASTVRPPLAKGDDGSANRYPSRLLSDHVSRNHLIAGYHSPYCLTCKVSLAEFVGQPFPRGEKCRLGHPVWIGTGDPEEGYCDGRCEQYDTIEAYDRQRDDDLTDRA